MRRLSGLRIRLSVFVRVSRRRRCLATAVRLLLLLRWVAKVRVGHHGLLTGLHHHAASVHHVLSRLHVLLLLRLLWVHLLLLD